MHTQSSFVSLKTGFHNNAAQNNLLLEDETNTNQENDTDKSVLAGWLLE